MTDRPLVIYHGNCADGFSAAWCFWRKHGDSADYFAGTYGKPPPDVTGRYVYLVDFSYSRPVVEQMVQEAKLVTLIDHHETAINALRGLTGLNQYVSLDNSGAMLAWKFLYHDESPPLLLGHIEDRDLWRFKLPNTREIQANVFSHAYTFETWDRLMRAGQAELLQMSVAGAAIERKHHKDLAGLLKLCKRRMVIAGHDVPVAGLPYTMSSDAGAIMSEGELFAACYVDTEAGRTFSLRSSPTGLNVADVAASFGTGGGGHKHAAGFSVPRSHALAMG